MRGIVSLSLGAPKDIALRAVDRGCQLSAWRETSELTTNSTGQGMRGFPPGMAPTAGQEKLDAPSEVLAQPRGHARPAMAILTRVGVLQPARPSSPYKECHRRGRPVDGRPGGVVRMLLRLAPHVATARRSPPCGRPLLPLQMLAPRGSESSIRGDWPAGGGVRRVWRGLAFQATQWPCRQMMSR